MEIRKLSTRLTKLERETIINISFDNENESVADRKVVINTTVLPDYNLLKERNWKQTLEYRYDDDSVCGGIFEGTINMLTFRSATAHKREMSEEQRQKSIERLRLAREKKASK